MSNYFDNEINENLDFKIKYIKYKNKYLNLKKKIYLEEQII